ncbi:MAG: hypothetical protein ACR2LL_08300 [Nitrosopumilus sp.]
MMFDRFKKQNKEIVEEFKNIDEKESQNLEKPDKLENESITVVNNITCDCFIIYWYKYKTRII